MAYADLQGRNQGSKKKDTWDYRLIFVIAYTVFLLGAIVSRLMPWSWISAGRTDRKSVFAEAKSKTDLFVPFAFMG